jgi:hypothetical protein
MNLCVNAKNIEVFWWHWIPWSLNTPLALVNITDTESINPQHKRKRAIYSAHHILNYRQRHTHAEQRQEWFSPQDTRAAAEWTCDGITHHRAHAECISVNNNKTQRALSLIRPNGTGAPLMRSISSVWLPDASISLPSFPFEIKRAGPAVGVAIKLFNTR